MPLVECAYTLHYCRQPQPWRSTCAIGFEAPMTVSLLHKRRLERLRRRRCQPGCTLQDLPPICMIWLATRIMKCADHYTNCCTTILWSSLEVLRALRALQQSAKRVAIHKATLALMISVAQTACSSYIVFVMGDACLCVGARTQYSYVG